MNRTTTLRPATLGRVSRKAAFLAVCLSVVGISTAQATPLNFTLFNVNSSNESRLDLVASADLAGGQLTSSAQYDPSLLYGDGSMSTLYNDTGNGSQLVTNVTQQSIQFPGGSTAIARNATGLFGNLDMAPGVGGTTGTDPADYGVVFSSPQAIAIPPIDLSPLGVNLTLNLGTLTSIDAKVALRDVVVDVVGGSVPLSPYSTYPQTFDASQLQVGIGGTADILLGATVTQGNILDYVATGVALTALQTALSGQGINLAITNNGFGAMSYTIGFGLTTAFPTTLADNTDATLGTLEHIGGNLRLTVPVDFQVVPSTPVDMLFSAQFGLSGKLIGQVPFEVVNVPEPSSVVLGLLASATLGLVALRRRKA